MKNARHDTTTKERLAKAVVYVSRGNFPEIAARASGLSVEEFKKTWSLGMNKTCPEGTPPETWELAHWFVLECEEAEARFEADAVKMLAESKGADSVRDLLGKRFDRWAKRERREVTTDAKVRIDRSGQTDEQLLTRLRELGYAPTEELEGAIVLPKLPEGQGK